MSETSKEIDLEYLKQTIDLARLSSPKPTNFRVGCIIVSNIDPPKPQVLSTGYTLELEGNTHAEQCALSKLAADNIISEDQISSILTPDTNATLYSSLEPCGKRLSGNLPCVQRIIATRRRNDGGGIRRVVFGAKEPGTFVQDSQSCKLLTEAGIAWEYLPSLEDQILEVAMEGHSEPSGASNKNQRSVQNVSQPYQASEENSSGQRTSRTPNDLPQRDERTMPRNPKKRIMEAPPGSELSNI